MGNTLTPLTLGAIPPFSRWLAALSISSIVISHASAISCFVAATNLGSLAYLPSPSDIKTCSTDCEEKICYCGSLQSWVTYLACHILFRSINFKLCLQSIWPNWKNSPLLQGWWRCLSSGGTGYGTQVAPAGGQVSTSSGRTRGRLCTRSSCAPTLGC